MGLDEIIHQQKKIDILNDDNIDYYSVPLYYYMIKMQEFNDNDTLDFKHQLVKTLKDSKSDLIDIETYIKFKKIVNNTDKDFIRRLINKFCDVSINILISLTKNFYDNLFLTQYAKYLNSLNDILFTQNKTNNQEIDYKLKEIISKYNEVVKDTSETKETEINKTYSDSTVEYYQFIDNFNSIIPILELIDLYTDSSHTIEQWNDYYNTLIAKTINLDDIGDLIHNLELKDVIRTKQVKKINKLLNMILNKEVKNFDDIIDYLSYNEYQKYTYKINESDEQVVNYKDLKQKNIPLILPKVFNGEYIINKSYNINQYDTRKDPINITFTIDEETLNDFSSLPIICDIYNNDNKMVLLPIDYPLFLAFTELNIQNGGNKAIKLQEAFKYIVESKGVRLRKSNKSYDIYKDRLLAFDRVKARFSIKDKKTNKNIYTLIDPMSILSNQRVLIGEEKETGYIIGNSSILTLINKLKEIYDYDFMASYNLSKEYIKDGQKNLIEILNMKYYILPKVLQRINSQDNKGVNNPLVNLEELYRQTAILKGKYELNKEDKDTLKTQINKFLNHLNNKGLILDYEYTNDDNKHLKISDLRGKKQRNIKYINIKVKR